MQYREMVEGVFLERSNRFVARVAVDGAEVICHVKNVTETPDLIYILKKRKKSVILK